VISEYFPEVSQYINTELKKNKYLSLFFFIFF